MRGSNEQRASSQRDAYESGPRQVFVDRHLSLPQRAWMLEVRQPEGDHSSRPAADAVLVQPVSPGIDMRKRWAMSRFEGIVPMGSFWFVPPGAAVDLEIRVPHTFRMIGFAPDVAAALLGSGSFPDLGSLSRGPFFENSLRRLLQHLWKAPCEPLRQEHALAEVIAIAARAAGQRVAPVSGGLAGRQIRMAIEMIADAPDGAVTLADLAAAVGLSPFHFAHAFRDSMGVAPYRFMKLLRLQRARDLLAGTNLSVLEVALAVGYESGQALARVFRQELGLTPQRYRDARLG